MKERKKVKLVHSIVFKIVSMALFGVYVTATIMLLMAGKNAQDVAKEISSNYALSMAETTAQSLDNVGRDNITLEFYENTLKNVELKGAESSYAYLVNGNNGNIVYHPSAEKIGKPVENEIIAEVVADIKAGKEVDASIATYQYNGATKYAAYAVTADKQIVVVTVDESEILRPIYTMTLEASVAALFIFFILAAICIVVSGVICKPIRILTDMLDDMGELNFKHNEKAGELRKRKDETGEMTRAMRLMRQNMREIINEITNISNQIQDDVNGVAEISDNINQMCADNSATNEELAAGMEETSATTASINGHISTIKIGAEEIKETASGGTQMSNEVMERANSLRDKTISASENTMQLYTDVKDKARSAIDGAKAVEQINTLIDSIMNISSQTNLLALNASIEAARAGEAGKGFAVVASEIGTLANQTSDTVKDIGEVVDSVNAAVGNMQTVYSIPWISWKIQYLQSSRISRV